MPMHKNLKKFLLERELCKCVNRLQIAVQITNNVILLRPALFKVIHTHGCAFLGFYRD